MRFIDLEKLGLSVKKRNCLFKHSTSEKFTGEYWIDGKKIYTKTIAFSGNSNGSININIETGLYVSNISSIFFDNQNSFLYMCNKGSTQTTIAINLNTTSSSGWYGVYTYFAQSNSKWVINLQTNANTAVPKGWITIRYTKTTG